MHTTLKLARLSTYGSKMAVFHQLLLKAPSLRTIMVTFARRPINPSVNGFSCIYFNRTILQPLYIWILRRIKQFYSIVVDGNSCVLSRIHITTISTSQILHGPHVVLLRQRHCGTMRINIRHRLRWIVRKRS